MYLMRIIFFCCFQVLVFSGKSQPIKGKVLDAETKEPLAFVNIIVNHSPDNGVTSDINGNFIINAHRDDTLVFSYVGYKKQKVAVENISDKVFMNSSTQFLPEYIFEVGQNPAIPIIQKAVANKRRNNPENLEAFSYLSYNKFSLAPDPSYLQDSSRLQEDDFDSVYYRTNKFFAEKDLFLIESVTRRKFRQPGVYNEEVLANKVSGFGNPGFTLLANDLQQFSFYPDFIKLIDKNYLNPLSKNSYKKYFFYLEDTLLDESDSVYIISFQPFPDTRIDAIKGVFYIHTNGYALQNVIAESIDSTGNIGWKIQQLYDHVEGAWFPIQLNTDLLLYASTESDMTLIGKGKSYLTDIKINPEYKKNEFKATVLDYKQNDSASNANILKRYRVESLEAKELNTYQFLDSLGRAEKFDQKLQTFALMATGEISFKFLSFPVDKIISGNRHEGLRLGLGIYSNNKFSEYLRLGGYFGYGFRDEKWKYGGSVQLNWPDTFLSFGYRYKNDIREWGSSSLFEPLMQGPMEEYRSFLGINMDRIVSHEIWFGFNLFKYLDGRLFTSVNHFDPLSVPSDAVSEFGIIETGVKLRFAYLNQYLNVLGILWPTGTQWPVLRVNYSRGFNESDGSYLYDKVLININKTFQTRNLGRPGFTLVSGLIVGDIPLSLSFNGRGSGIREFNFETGPFFQTMLINEFFNDRFLMLFYDHEIFKLNPKISWADPSLHLITNLGLGSAGDILHYDGFEFKEMNQGFYESGISFRGLLVSGFSKLGLGLFYRWGPERFDSFSENLFVNLNFQFSIE